MHAYRFPFLVLILATAFGSATANKHTSAVLQGGVPFWDETKTENNDATTTTATSPYRDEMHPLWRAGLQGQGQVVGVGDSGLDLTSCWLSDTSGASVGPTHRKVLAYRSLGDFIDAIGHGTHVVATIIGDAGQGSMCGSDTSDSTTESQEHGPCSYNGMAPKAKVSFTDLGVGSTGNLFLPETLSEYFDADKDNGAFVHSNSWGNDVNAYDEMAHDVDQYVWKNRDFLPIFAAGNYGGFAMASSTGTFSTVTSPSTSKNCLSIGATLGAEGPVMRPEQVGDSIDMDVELVKQSGQVVKNVGSFRAYLSEIQIDKGARPFFSQFINTRDKKHTIQLVRAFPLDACTALKTPGDTESIDGVIASTDDSTEDDSKEKQYYSGAAVLVSRGTCLFSEKILNAQNAGVEFVLVSNDKLGGFFKMSAEVVEVDGDDDSPSINIPSASVPKSTGDIFASVLGNRKENANTFVRLNFRKARLSKKRIDVIAGFSSFGPTDDGRIKPDLVAPGEIESAAAASVGDFEFPTDYPRVQQGEDAYTDSKYTCAVMRIAGTSMATPVVAGAALLVRQYFEQGWYERSEDGHGKESEEGSGRDQDSQGTTYPDKTAGFKPTAALIKATLINGASSMDGFTESGLPLEPPPSIRQGFGRASVGRSLPIRSANNNRKNGSKNGSNTNTTRHYPDGMFVKDDVPIATGETHSYCVLIPFGFKTEELNPRELRVTLAWTDAPAKLPLRPGQSALVNDLDLVVVEGEEVASSSVPDRVNNVERFVKRVQSSKRYFIKVTGFSVTQAPPDVPQGQPYALVVTAPGLRLCDEVDDEERETKEDETVSHAVAEKARIESRQRSRRLPPSYPKPVPVVAVPGTVDVPDSNGIVSLPPPLPPAQKRKTCPWYALFDPKCW